MIQKKYNFIIQVILINLIIFVILPFNLVLDKSYNLRENLSFDIFLMSLNLFLVFSIIFILIIFLLNFLLSLINIKQKLIHNTIFFILVWTFFIGFFFPVTGEHDPFLSSFFSIRLRYIFLLKLFLILLIVIYITKKNYLKKFQFFFSLYILINLVFILFSILLYEKNESTKEIYKFGNKNLIVLSLDGISGFKIHKEININNNFKNELKDFKFYNNVTSAWPATVNSLNAELNSKVLKINDENLSKNILNDENIDAKVYGNYKHFMKNKENVVYRGKYKNYGNAYNINSFFQKVTTGTFSRWGTPIILSFFENYVFYSKFYKFFLNIISFDFNNENNPYTSGIHTRYMVHMNEFDLIFKDTVFDSSLSNTIRMYHFSFSHWPLRLDQNCKEVKKLNVELYQQEEIVIKCLALKISLFLNILKKKVFMIIQ